MGRDGSRGRPRSMKKERVGGLRDGLLAAVGGRRGMGHGDCGGSSGGHGPWRTDARQGPASQSRQRGSDGGDDSWRKRRKMIGNASDTKLSYVTLALLYYLASMGLYAVYMREVERERESTTATPAMQDVRAHVVRTMSSGCWGR